jgi:hypothetical protein
LVLSGSSQSRRRMKRGNSRLGYNRQRASGFRKSDTNL